jgi:uncharacterized protein (DUF433 family)
VGAISSEGRSEQLVVGLDQRESCYQITDMTTAACVIHRDPHILGGIPVFIGTRVPIKTLLDYLEAGDSLDEFLDHFPNVRREHAIAALEFAKEMLTVNANPA